ncbi:MAG TPA: ABC transporter ATP-binding protein [Vicinamibacteria bacterium]|nr:ABC transporter ATP-binding protein [Vicinamibacteria bacterium]
MTTAAVEARDVRLERGGRPVLRGVSLALFPGEALALVGPNASGKSTLLRALAGLLPVASGELSVEGRALREWTRPALARRVALVAAEDEAPARLAVADRVRLGRYPYRGPLTPFTADDEAAVGRALRLAEIEHLAGRALGTLSAGERQLALLARGLAQEPSVLLLDEPAAHLDIRHQLHLLRLIDEVRAQGVAVLAVIHDLQRAAWAPRMALLEAGRIAAAGTPAEVLESEAAGRAFGVAIRGVGEGTHRLWRFEQRA